MKWVFGAAFAVATVFAGSASAATYYEITLRGQLVSERGERGYDNTGIDPNLAVSDYLVIKARFSSDRLVAWGDHGYSLIGFYGLPTTGDEYWRIEAPGGMVWNTRDDMMDGKMAFQDLQDSSRNVSYPAIAIEAGKVVGVGGVVLEGYGSSRPVIDMGYSLGSGMKDCYDECFEQFAPGTLSSSFQVSAGNGLYGNQYNSQGFNGVWDFAGSAVTAVPEPATWAMMISGFGLAGAGLRRSRRTGVGQPHLR